MEKNKLNLSLFLGIVLAMFFVGVGTICAADAPTVVIDYPAANGHIYGAATSNVTNVSVTVTNAANNFNCSYYLKSASTANSTWETVFNGSVYANFSDESWIYSFDSRIVEDANDYILNVTCTNESTTADDTNTGITIDNTIPDTPTLTAITTDTDGILTFTGSVNDSETTSCTLHFPDTNPQWNSYTMTYATTNCSYTFTSAIPEASYRWYIRASDGSNTTDSSVETTTVDVPNTAAGNSMTPEQIAQTEGTSGFFQETIGDTGIPVWVVVAVILGIVGFTLFRKK